jgi:hypothetical protein|tara:strand:- start:883 stop:1410 length:528 start_codon:yes stop_codon:yes gene_type:complete
MATFPNISPNSISFELGGMNVSATDTKPFGDVYFRHSLKTDNLVVSATFENLSSATAKQIRDHYLDQGGGSLPFKLVTASFWGTVGIIPTDSLYRYTGPPEEEHFGVYNNVTTSFLVQLGTPGFFVLVGEPAQLGAEEAFTSFAFSGTAPFILDADDADPAVATSLILNAGGANQ